MRNDKGDLVDQRFECLYLVFWVHTAIVKLIKVVLRLLKETWLTV